VSARLSEHWLGGRLVPAAQLASPTRGDGSVEHGCYTTARVRDGVARHAEAHASRLARDTHALGLEPVASEIVLELFSTLGRHAFGEGEGVIRVEARATGRAAQLRGIPRALGPDQATWSACTATFPHRGPSPSPGAKLLDDPLYERARALAGSEGVDEVLLLDRSGRLVEGARSNLLVADAGGRLYALDLALGAVAGIALEAIREAVPELGTRDIHAEQLGALREIIAVNAVRGARAIVSLDDRPVGSGEPGPWADRLDELLARA